MRLAPLLLWIAASLLWLPWFLVFVRLLIDLASGTPVEQSAYLNPALVGAWPVLGWLHWRIVSWLPIFALAALGLSIYAWRIKAHIEDHLLFASAPQRFLSMLVPPLAFWWLYLEARSDFHAKNELLDEAAQDAEQRLRQH